MTDILEPPSIGSLPDEPATGGRIAQPTGSVRVRRRAAGAAIIAAGAVSLGPGPDNTIGTVPRPASRTPEPGVPLSAGTPDLGQATCQVSLPRMSFCRALSSPGAAAAAVSSWSAIRWS